MPIRRIKAQSPDPYLGKIKGDTELARLAHLNYVIDEINKGNGGGGTGKHVDIWFAKNGNAIPFSNTRVDVDTNTPYQVAAWNFFVDAAAGDYYQLMWATDNVSIVIEQEPVGTIHPATPSVIITVNQVGA